MRTRCCLCLGWTILLWTGVGCGDSRGPVRVQGTVTLDGKPVAGASVQFIPDGNTSRPAFAETQADGTYQIMTKDPGDGAMPGDYKVIVTWQAPSPPQFRSGEEGGPSRQEMQTALDQFQAKQKKAGKGPSIPEVYGDPSKTPLKVKVPAPSGRADLALSSKP